MRQIILGDAMLARPPTPEEYDFLKAQRKARQDTGFPVGTAQDELGWPRTRFARRLPGRE
jgi:hypothetical protein